MNARIPTRKATTRRGQTLVEFAVAILVILVFLFGVIDWGIAYHMHQRVVHQAAEAARWVSVRGRDANTILAPARNIVLCGYQTCDGSFPIIGLTSDQITITTPLLYDDISSGTSTADPRYHVVIEITNYRYQMFTPFVGKLLSPRRFVVSHPMECIENICPIL